MFPFSINDFLKFIAKFCSLAGPDFKSASPLVFKFYVAKKIQIRFHFLYSASSFFLFTVLEDVEEKLNMGNLSSKFNYNHLLVCSLSHELYTPMHHLINGTDSLKTLIKKHIPSSTPAHSEFQDVVKLISDESHGLTVFTQNMLDFGMFLNRTISVAKERFNVSDAIKYIAGIFGSKVSKKNIKMNIECDSSICIESDQDKLKGLLYIFLDNSLKYTFKGEVTIKVECEEASRYLRISISDTGIGISETDLNILANILRDPFTDLRPNSAAGIGIGFRVAQVLLTYLAGGDLIINLKSEKESLNNSKSPGTSITFDILKESKAVEWRSLRSSGKQGATKSMTKSVGGYEESGGIYDERGIGISILEKGNMNQSVIKTNTLKLQSKSYNFTPKGLFDLQEVQAGTNSSNHGGFAAAAALKMKNQNIDDGGDNSQRDFNMPSQHKTPKVAKMRPSKSQHKNSQNTQTCEIAMEELYSEKRYVKLEVVESDIQDLSPILKKIAIIVDDEIINADFLKSQLETLGLEVYTAYDGERGIEVCLNLLTCNKKVDIIFMDYSMPIMNGDECAKILRSSKFDPILKKTAIIGLTAHRDADIKQKCLHAGMTAVEFKPFGYEQAKQLLIKFGLISKIFLTPTASQTRIPFKS